MTNNLPATITFENTEISIIDRNGQAWITSADLARALGCSYANQITNLYQRNKDEFSADMTEIIKLITSGKNLIKRTRIFSLRGARMVAILAKTKPAKKFRRDVLDVLEGISEQPKPLPKAKTPELLPQYGRTTHWPTLPFVSDKKDMPRYCFWDVEKFKTGDWAKDMNTGRKFARETVTQITKEQATFLLGWIMHDMREARGANGDRCGIETGFFGGIVDAIFWRPAKT